MPLSTRLLAPQTSASPLHNGLRFGPRQLPPAFTLARRIAVGTSPQGHALKFVHRGSYDGLDNTYEAITKFLDDKRLQAKDMFIEQM
jgi:hypothetical protein